MEIAVIGNGFIGGILGRALAGAGHHVTFGSRHPDDTAVADGKLVDPDPRLASGVGLRLSSPARAMMMRR